MSHLFESTVDSLVLGGQLLVLCLQVPDQRRHPATNGKFIQQHNTKKLVLRNLFSCVFFLPITIREGSTCMGQEVGESVAACLSPKRCSLASLSSVSLEIVAAISTVLDSACQDTAG